MVSNTGMAYPDDGRGAVSYSDIEGYQAQGGTYDQRIAGELALLSHSDALGYRPPTPEATMVFPPHHLALGLT